MLTPLCGLMQISHDEDVVWHNAYFYRESKKFVGIVYEIQGRDWIPHEKHSTGEVDVEIPH